MANQLTPEEKNTSMRHLQRRLILAGLVDHLDPTPEEMKAALEQIPDITHIRVLQPLVWNDGIWAALRVLGDVELVIDD